MKKYCVILLFLLLPSLVFASTNTVLYTKDMGSGIVMEQIDASTVIKFKGKVLESYSNIYKKSPFVADEGCQEYTDAISKITYNNDNRRQIAWNSLGEKLQRQCIREHYRKTISLNTVADSKRFLLLSHGWWEGFDSTIIDLKYITSKRIGESSVKNILTGKTGTYIQTEQGRGDCSGDIYLVNSIGKFITQFSMCNLVKYPDSATLNSFELLEDSQIKVIFTLNEKIVTQILKIKTK